MENIDEKIKELFSVLENKRKEIELAEKPRWKTHLSFRYIEDSKNTSDVINLGVVKEEKTLIDMASFLILREKAWKDASSLLGSNLKFKWLNYSAEDWLEDIKNRMVKIKIDEKKREFTLLEDKLNKLVSPEERRRIELEEISKTLGV